MESKLDPRFAHFPLSDHGEAFQNNRPDQPDLCAPSQKTSRKPEPTTIARVVPVDQLLEEMRIAIKTALSPVLPPAMAVKNLSGIRQAAGMTQAEVARTLGIAQSSVSSLENGSDLLFSTLARYVSALAGECDVVVTLKDNTRLALKLQQG